MPVYPKGKSRWLVVIYHQGRRVDRIVKGKKSDAEAFEAKERVALEAGGIDSLRVVPTFSEFCLNEYKEHAELHQSAWNHSAKYTIATLVEHFGHLKLSRIAVLDLEFYKTKRAKEGKRASTINKEIRQFQSIISTARAMGISASKIKVKPIAEGRRRVVAWSKDEIAKLLKSASEHAPQLLPILVFLANTGCRRGEALALEWPMVDLERRLVRIEPNEEWKPKNNKPREIPIPDVLVPWLSGKREGRWVFPSRKGIRYAQWPKDALERVRDEAGITGGVHRLRHSYATFFLSKCPDICLLGQIMGPLQLAHHRTLHASVARPPVPRSQRGVVRLSGRCRRTEGGYPLAVENLVRRLVWRSIAEGRRKGQRR